MIKRIQISKNLSIFWVVFTLISFTGYAQNWTSDFDTVRQLSRKNNQPILMIFQKENQVGNFILNSKELMFFVESNFNVLNINYPKKSRGIANNIQNLHRVHLEKRYNKQYRFPYLVVADCKGRIKEGIPFNLVEAPSNYLEKLEDILDQ